MKMFQLLKLLNNTLLKLHHKQGNLPALERLRASDFAHAVNSSS